ncbi:MAG: hypothetical protein RBQ91_00885 [Acholeplasma sp.]|nr:hypothetical protein [Acholeplasma sp.]
MKSFLKILIGLSIISYFNLLLITYQIRTDGLDSIQLIWILTISIPVLLSLVGFSESFKQYKRYTFIDLLLKVTIIVIVLQSSDLEEQWYLVFNLLTIPLFIANIMTELFLYSDYNKYLSDKKEVELSYYQLFQESLKNPTASVELQEKFIHAIRYSRTLLQLLIAGVFYLLSIISVLTILREHTLLTGIVFGVLAVGSILIFSWLLGHTIRLHWKLGNQITRKSKLKNTIYIGLMLVIIGSTTVLISVFNLQIELYLLVPTSYIFAIPMVVANNHFADVWKDQITKIIQNQQ